MRKRAEGSLKVQKWKSESERREEESGLSLLPAGTG